MRLEPRRIQQRAGELLGGFTAGQKTVLALAVAGVLVGGLLVARTSQPTERAALYTDLSAADAAAVTEELRSRGVGYQLEDQGRTVTVARDDVYALRIELSAQGLPAGEAKGYALLDDQGITTSEFRQRVDYQRALEGELTRTIGAIDGVEGANVHLVMPEHDLFSGDDVRPTASVLVHTRSDAPLAPRQVQAVVHLVASSVEGLSPDDVTVADATGAVLSAPGTAGDLLAAGDLRATQTAAFEDQLATSIEEMLVPLVGRGGAIVRVSAQLDHDQRSTTTERFDAPAEGQASPVATETTSSETYAGAATAVGGALGPDGTPTTGDGGDTQYEKEAATRTYAVGKVTEQVEAAPGAVQRLSVAVLLDSGASGAAGTAEVERLVSAAAGLDTGRGDLLAVSEMPFDRTPVEAPVTAAPADGSSPVDLVRPVGAVLLALVVLAAAWRSAHRATAVQRIPLPLPAGAGGGYPALDEIGPGVLDDDADGVDGTAELALPAPMALGPAEADERTVVKEQIADLIERQPDQVAQVLRGWLADRRS